MMVIMPKLEKTKNLSLVEDVTHQIEDAILYGEYKPGDKLPSTRKLQEVFGASLGNIRINLMHVLTKAMSGG